MLNFIARGENDDGSGVAPLPQAAQDADSIAGRQAEVQEHDVECRGLQSRGRLTPVADPIHRGSRLAQRRLQALRDHDVVFDQ